MIMTHEVRKRCKETLWPRLPHEPPWRNRPDHMAAQIPFASLLDLRDPLDQ
jgi:hypothetical protein